MPFDAPAPAAVTARDRMIQLRDFLETLPPERFDMSNYYIVTLTGNVPAHWFERPTEVVAADCGTSACICGWASVLRAPKEPFSEDKTAKWLGLNGHEAHALFYPPGYSRDVKEYRPYTRTQAVAVLDHYLATGKIDWSVA